MNTSTRGMVRGIWVATRAMLLCTVVLGVAYTLVITGIGQLVLPAQANGSIVTGASGQPVGSSLIGQSFADEEGAPNATYFQSRPSAAGDGYDGRSSAASNYGPENEALIEAIKTRKSQVAAFNNVAESKVPADAVTASSSGLDPHISLEYANIQIERVAQSRGLDALAVRQLVAAHTAGPNLGYLGEATVNVLQLNIALDNLKG